MVLRVRPTPTQFPTSIFHTPVNNTVVRSIAVGGSRFLHSLVIVVSDKPHLATGL